MPTEQQIDAAAAAAAEKANGGRFVDPLFYAPEHRQFWRNVIRAALEAAEAAIPQDSASRKNSRSDDPDHVKIFKWHDNLEGD